MPEECQSEQSVETRDVRESAVSKRAIQEEMIRFGTRVHQRVFQFAIAPGFEYWELMQVRKTRVGNQPSRMESPKVRLAGQGGERAIARQRSHQVHALQIIAELEIRYANIRDTALP